MGFCAQLKCLDFVRDGGNFDRCQYSRYAKLQCKRFVHIITLYTVHWQWKLHFFTWDPKKEIEKRMRQETDTTKQRPTKFQSPRTARCHRMRPIDLTKSNPSDNECLRLPALQQQQSSGRRLDVLILQDMHERSKSFSFVRFPHEGRNFNREAHMLAKSACTLSSGRYIWLESPPVLVDVNTSKVN